MSLQKRCVRLIIQEWCMKFGGQTNILTSIGSAISRSAPGCPWENGYQESFYDKFKIDLGDSNRFRSFGELIVETYRTVWVYNHTRIHTALKMPPATFAFQAHVPHNASCKVSV